LVLGFALVAGIMALAPELAAQESTPAGEAVDPGLCTVDPRTVDELVVIFMEGDYVPDEEIAAGTLPQGEPADEATVTAVDETMRLLIACANAGNYRAQMALFTDDGVQFFGPESSDATEEDIRQFFAETPVEAVPEDERERFAGLSDIQVLSEGRVGAVYGGTPQDPGAAYVIFLEVDGRYLIDHVTELDSTGATPEATPSQ
jgi:hypothetical protein